VIRSFVLRVFIDILLLIYVLSSLQLQASSGAGDFDLPLIARAINRS
jgi:hypothetical protein